MRYFLGFLFTITTIITSAQQLDPGILLSKNTSTFHQNAIDLYSGIIERNPSDVKSILLRSELHRALNNMDAANADVELAMSINPYSFLYLSKKERDNFFAKRNYSYFSDNSSEMLLSFDKSYILDEEYNRIIAEKLLTEKTKPLLGLVLVAMELKDYENAERLMSAINEEDKNSAIYHDLAGVLLLEKGEVEMSIQQFDIAIEKDALFTIAYHNRAVANKLLKNYDAAREDFTTALRQRADLAKIQFSKAKLLELQGDVDGARYFYESAISTEEDYAEARLNYSVLLKSAGEYTRSLIEINNLVAEFPEDSNNYYVRGGLHFIYGEYSKAVKDFDTYLSFNPDDYDVLFYRGLCLVLDGKVERGCSDINVSIEQGYDEHDELYLFMCE
ncbi:MAG: tetratricopeptide repeat protein [Bacteroidota bacterium]